MDLISRKAVKEEIKDEWDGSCSEYGPKQIINDTLCAVDRIPTVPAVPLDKLCEFCEEIGARVPCVMCNKIMPEWCMQNNNLPLGWDEEWKCPTWKQLLTKWMEEQDADD